jgi:hypothetical protein
VVPAQHMLTMKPGMNTMATYWPYVAVYATKGGTKHEEDL